MRCIFLVVLCCITPASMEDTRGVKRKKQDGAHELGQFIGQGGVSLTGLKKIGQLLAKSSSAADALASSTRKSLME